MSNEKFYREMFNEFGENVNSMMINILVTGLSSNNVCVNPCACDDSIAELTSLERGLNKSTVSEVMKEHWLALIKDSKHKCKLNYKLLVS